MKIRNLLFGAFVISLFATCKKTDNPYTAEPKYTGSVQVGFNNYVDANGAFGFVNKALIFKDTLLDADIELKITNATGTAPNQIKVYLAKNDAIVSDYNSMNGTQYLVAPSTSSALTYDFSKPVIIEQGARSAKIPITINPSKLSGPTGLGLVLQRVEGADIQEIQNKLVVAISALNIYDGNYTIKGYLVHPTSAYVGPFSVQTCGDIALITSGTNSVDLSPGQPFSNAGALSVFAVYPRFNVNPATNAVTVTDANPAAGVMFAPPITTYNSRYNPLTKTFYVQYGWNSTRLVTDTLVYCGPR